MSPSPSRTPCGGLDRLELGAGHRLAGLEPVDLAVARRVQQHAAADDAVRVGGDAAPLRAARGQQRDGLAVVELSAIADVVERIDVGVAVAVAGHAEEAHPERQPALADREVVHERHEVHGGIGVVGPGHLVDRDRHRDGAPAAHQGGGGGHLVGRQVVERAALVVRPPATPVLDGLEHGVEVGKGDRSGRGQGSRHRPIAFTASVAASWAACRRRATGQGRQSAQCRDREAPGHRCHLPFLSSRNRKTAVCAHASPTPALLRRGVNRAFGRAGCRHIIAARMRVFCRLGRAVRIPPLMPRLMPPSHRVARPLAMARAASMIVHCCHTARGLADPRPGHTYGVTGSSSKPAVSGGEAARARPAEFPDLGGS